MSRPKNPCAFCGKKAEYLCDFQITVAGVDRGIPVTCDTALCKGCRVKDGTIFVKGTEGCSVDTFDYCPNHPNRDTSHPYPIRPMAVRVDKCQVTQDQEVEQWREEHQVAIARYCINKVDSSKPKPELLWAVYDESGNRMTMACGTAQSAKDDMLSQTTASWPQLEAKGYYLHRVKLTPWKARAVA